MASLEKPQHIEICVRTASKKKHSKKVYERNLPEKNIVTKRMKIITQSSFMNEKKKTNWTLMIKLTEKGNKGKKRLKLF